MGRYNHRANCLATTTSLRSYSFLRDRRIVNMDEEFVAIYRIVRDEIYAALGHDIEIELIMPPGHRSNKRGSSGKHPDGTFEFYLFGGADNDEQTDI